MTDFKEPRTEIEWSRRAIINVVEVLRVYAGPTRGHIYSNDLL